MIVLVCGPSGSGKTTLLKRISTLPNCYIKKIVVCRNNNRLDDDFTKTEVLNEEFLLIKNNFHFIYNYNDSTYGIIFIESEFYSSDYYFLDYPGEYPECIEFSKQNWKGILVLPPDKETLIARLTKENRAYRNESAVLEYNDCLFELEEKKYDNKRWIIYISENENILNCFIENFKKLIL